MESFIAAIEWLTEYLGEWGLPVALVALVTFVAQIIYYARRYGRIATYRRRRHTTQGEEPPAVSVIIPFFDPDFSYFERVIPKLQQQTHPRFEVIFVVNTPDEEFNAQLTEEFCKSGDITTIENSQSSPIIGRPFCGGAFIVNAERYLSICGENEKFTGWGPEDAERLRRCRILGHKANWICTGMAYHLAHPINTNSRYFNQEMADNMRREFVSVCCMNSVELKEYITKN